jgi:hypothetical protein
VDSVFHSILKIKLKNHTYKLLYSQILVCVCVCVCVFVCLLFKSQLFCDLKMNRAGPLVLPDCE